MAHAVGSARKPNGRLGSFTTSKMGRFRSDAAHFDRRALRREIPRERRAERSVLFFGNSKSLVQRNDPVPIVARTRTRIRSKAPEVFPRTRSFSSSVGRITAHRKKPVLAAWPEKQPRGQNSPIFPERGRLNKFHMEFIKKPVFGGTTI